METELVVRVAPQKSGSGIRCAVFFDKQTQMYTFVFPGRSLSVEEDEFIAMAAAFSTILDIESGQE